MSDQFLISLIIPAKLVLIYLIVLYFKKRKARGAQQNAEAIERIKIKEYGRKINEETRNRKIN